MARTTGIRDYALVIAELPLGLGSRRLRDTAPQY